MKQLAIAIIATFASFAVSATSVTVYGVGTDRESAKRDAFRTAIENVCGIKVLSKRENFNDKNIFNEVLTHSTCRVISYKILEETNNPHTIKIDVTLHNTQLEDRLHGESNGFRFSGELKDHVEGYYKEKQTGDQLINLAFRDYPYRAYNLKQTKKPYITDDHFRNLYLVIPYKINWNYDFIQTMRDIFSNVDSRRGSAKITIVAKDPKAWMLGQRNDYYINDYSKLALIKEKFTGDNELRIRVQARDNKGKRILNICYSPEYKAGGIFYSVGVSRELTIFGNDVNEGQLEIRLNFPAEVIYDLSVDVAADRDCKLYTSPI